MKCKICRSPNNVSFRSDYKFEIDNFCNFHLGGLKDMQKIKGKTLKLAVVVTNVEHRESKNGNRFASVTVEDYQDSYKLMLFGNNYTEYKNFLEEGWVLYVTGVIQSRQWGDTDQLEFKVSKISLLSELINSENRTLVLKISLEDIKEDLVDSLINKIQYNKGTHNLILNVKDIKKQNAVDLLSRKYKINLDKNVIDDLKTINGLEVFIK